MSNYTKIQNWVSLAGTSISGTPFDTEFAAVATASATKSNKKIPAATNNIPSLSSTGDLQDSGLLTSDVLDAVSFHYSTGDIKATAVESEPTGWLYCDGATLSTSTYPALFSAIGYTFGGSGAEFNTPDLRGRALVALDNLGGTSANVLTDAAVDSLGGVLGAETVTLDETTMPGHTHALSSDGAHTHSITYNDKNFDGGTAGGDDLSGTGNTDITSSNGVHTHTVSSTGDDGAHANVQPVIAMNYLIKT